jgi:predicted Rossmann fold nucleotide-binding protein DprA/Smf involved in DNA uptake
VRREAKPEPQPAAQESTAIASLASTQFRLLLHSIPHAGDKAVARLLAGCARHRLAPATFLNLNDLELSRYFELDPRAIGFLSSNRGRLLAETAEAARRLRAFPLHIVATTDATYPARLISNMEDAPPLLYTLGNLMLLEPYCNRKPAFTYTVAASRSAGAGSLARLDELATDLAVMGGTPVTGHDRPEYQRLALAAQRRGLPTIYVFDRGLREALGPEFDRPPFPAARIRDVAFDFERDLAVSPFRLDDHGIGANNRRRDRMIFALSDLLIALDVRAEGAMYKLCRKAQEQSKLLFVCSGGRDGNEALLAAGAPELPETSIWPTALLHNLK